MNADAVFQFSSNTLPVKPQVRKPRALVKINDEVLGGWTDWEVEQNIAYYADTFTVRFAKAKLPPERDDVWFSQQKLIYVEILAGFPTNPDRPDQAELTSLIYGRVDDITDDVVSRTITLTGRDFTSVLIDTKLSAQFQNKTSSEIAEQIAADNGLTPVVTKTTEQIGQYLAADHINMIDQRSAWDWLTYFADRENFIVYVKGLELHFEPKTDATDAYVIRYTPPAASDGYPQSNAERLTFRRSLTIAKGVTVTIRGTEPGTLRRFEVSYPTDPKTIAPGRAKIGNQRVQHAGNVQNKTRAQAEKIAEQKFLQITHHEKKLDADLPGDLELDVTQTIRVEGTGTDYDQVYYPVSVVRSMDCGGGFTMRVSAQNTSPDPLL